MVSVKGNWTIAVIVLMAAAAAVLSTSVGLRQSLGLFMEPMVRGTGISVSGFGLAMAIQNLAWGIGQPFMGGLADRYGGRGVILVAALFYAIGLVLMGTAGISGLMIGGGLLIGLATAGTSFGVIVGEVSRGVSPEIRQTVVSIVAAAGSIGTFVLAPVAQEMIEGIGWKAGLFIFAGLALAISMMAMPLKVNGGKTGAAARSEANAGKAIREAMSHPGFLAMTAAFFACGFQLIFVATHLPNYISICGLPPSVGAQSLALIGGCNAVGTLVIGKLGQRYGNKLMLAIVYMGRTTAIVAYVMLPVSVESTLIFAATMGFFWLSVVPLVSGLISGMFGLANFGVLFGVMFLSHQVGSFLGAWLGGLTFDMSGSYFIAWMSLVVIGALAAIVQLSMDDRPRPKLQPATG